MAGATTDQSVRDLDAEIDCLLALRAERNVFLHPLWLRTWFGEFGGSREALLLTSGNGSVTGVAPLMRDEGRLTFLGDPSICDYMDFLVGDGGSEEAYRQLWQRVCGEDWAELDLWGLPEASPTRLQVMRLARESGCGVAEELEAVAPRIELPSSWDEYLLSLSKKDRHELRRKLRRLHESGARVDFTVASQPSDVAAQVEEFLRLHTISRHDKAEFMTGAMPSFFRRMALAMAGAGLLRLFMLRLDDKPAATVMCFDAGCCLYMYNSGYDPEFSPLAVGLLSKAMVIEWAIGQGKASLDFLRGNEPYKYDLGARDRRIYRLVVRR